MANLVNLIDRSHSFWAALVLYEVSEDSASCFSSNYLPEIFSTSDELAR